MSEREGSHRERGATTAARPAEERAQSERERSHRERGATTAARTAATPGGPAEERA
jgi:hypothetical protein